MDNSLRIAHISDLHFAHISYDFRQLFSKRWLGNANLILYRQKTYLSEQLWQLPELLAPLNLDAIIITGDVATTSLPEEFEKAQHFIKSLEAHSRVFLIPGNHDCYTKESQRKQTYYRFFPQKESPFQQERMEVALLKQGWWWVGLDTAYASSLFLSTGKFFSSMEKPLRALFSKIPEGDSIVLGNHFPLFSTGKPRHDLIGCRKLQAILREFPSVKVYLHGHDHSPYITDRMKQGYPLSINAGSAAQNPIGTFYILELQPHKTITQQYKWHSDIKRWQSSLPEIFENPARVKALSE